MTIEERYGCIGCKLASCEGCDSFLLVKGATEQKAIDEKRIAELESFVERATKLIEAEKAFREHLEAKEKKLIEKAWRWIEQYRHMDTCWTMEQMEEHFRKSMME